MAGAPRNPYARFTADELILRDVLAAERTVLANERTLLAYVRTALALFITGAALAQYVDGLAGLVVGWLLMLFGGVLLAAGTVRYLRMRRSLHLVQAAEASRGNGAPPAGDATPPAHGAPGDGWGA